MSVPGLVPLKPALGATSERFESFCKSLVEATRTPSVLGDVVREFRKRLFEERSNDMDTIRLLAAQSLILDLVAQGNRLVLNGQGVSIETPDNVGLSNEDAKERVRTAHLVNRASQLAEPSVIEFVTGLEKLRLTPKGWRSIYSLMRDGRDLAMQLAKINAVPESEDKLKELRKVISPYIQFVEPDATCDHTGIRLQDIWRYFRHTWITEYKSLPGRNIQILIRDAATENHSVIGIAALGSSVVQHTKRDTWIGWDSDTLLARISREPTKRWATWLLASLERLLEAVYTQDLRDDGTISLLDLKHPTAAAVTRLRGAALRAAEQHRRFPHAAAHKNFKHAKEEDWIARARTSLFKAKRCDALADLLEVRISFESVGFRRGTVRKLKGALQKTDFQKAARRVVHRVKSESVGSSMMDIVVCGAIAPYNHLLGGKLICALMFSPEVVRHYHDRYIAQDSVIASAMRGKAVKKPAKLVLLGTTSLYGVGSSQYNRIKIPLKELGARGTVKTTLEYVDLGVTKGYGSYHFSRDTIELIDLFLTREAEGRRVNSIFGEGVNPLMRKLRDGLESLSFPSDQILKHGNTRIVYGVPLASNFAEVLIGLDSKPKYLLPQNAPNLRTKKLAEYWMRRWVLGRIARDGVLDNVARHSLAYPVSHGAKVELSLPQAELDM